MPDDKPAEAAAAQPARAEASGRPRFHWSLRYGSALLAVAAAGLLRHVLTGSFGTLPTYITFYPAVMLVAALAGPGPGILATLLVSAFADYFYLEPAGQFGYGTTAENAGLAIFALMGLGISALAGKMHRTRRQDVRESDERLAGIVDLAMDAIITVDDAQRIVMFNTAAEKMFGLSRAEAIGQPLERLLPARLRRSHVRHVRAFAEAGTTNRSMGELGAVSGLRANGEEFPVEASISQVEVRGRKLFTAILRDITERQRAKAALRESEARLRTFIENAPAAIAMFDPDMRYIAVSGRWLSDYGLGGRDIVGRSHYEVFPEISAEWKNVHRRALAGEIVRSVEDRFERLDGSVQWLHWEVRPWHTEGARLGGIVIFSEDITDRKRAEQALLESREDMNRAQAMARAGSWRLNVRRNELLWSEENWRIFGVPKGTPLTYETFLSTAHPEDREYVDACWQAGLRGEHYDIEHRIVVGEEVKWVRERAELEFDREGTLLGGFGTTQDITERKQAEQALQRMKDTLEQQVAERTAQLRAVAGELAMVEERERRAVAQDLHDDLGQVLATAKIRLTSLAGAANPGLHNGEIGKIEALLDHANNSVRSLATHLSPPVLRIDGLVPALEWLAGEMERVHGLTVNLHDDGKPKPVEEPARSTLFRVVRELLVNVPKHARVLSADLDCLCNEGRLVIVVSDCGSGFDYGKALSGQSGASGFGLLSVRERMTVIGGEMHVDSAPGEGTVITLTLPLSEACRVQ